jgi:hypothetical protein
MLDLFAGSGGLTRGFLDQGRFATAGAAAPARDGRRDPAGAGLLRRRMLPHLEETGRTTEGVVGRPPRSSPVARPAERGPVPASLLP